MSPPRTTLLVLAALTALAAVPVASLVAQDDLAELKAERARVAKEELAKAVAKGKELWGARTYGKKSCAACHEDPDKPDIDLSTREWSYPAYSRRKRKVVTLHQKINEMIKYQCKGKTPLDVNSEEAAQLAAYCVSLRKTGK